MPTTACPACRSGWRGYSKNCRAADDGCRSAQDLRPAFEARAAQLFEEQPAPEKAHQTIGVPERKGDGETYIAHSEDGERIGDGPEHSAQQRPNNQVRFVA